MTQGLTWQEEGSVRKYLVNYRKSGAQGQRHLGEKPSYSPTTTSSGGLASFSRVRLSQKTTLPQPLRST